MRRLLQVTAPKAEVGGRKVRSAQNLLGAKILRNIRLLSRRWKPSGEFTASFLRLLRAPRPQCPAQGKKKPENDGPRRFSHGGASELTVAGNRASTPFALKPGECDAAGSRGVKSEAAGKISTPQASARPSDARP